MGKYDEAESAVDMVIARNTADYRPYAVKGDILIQPVKVMNRLQITRLPSKRDAAPNRFFRGLPILTRTGEILIKPLE